MTQTTTNESPATTVTMERIVAYCAYENKMQKNVYPARIDAGKIKPDTARLNYKIIRDVGRLAAKCLEKGISWEALLALVETSSTPPAGGDPTDELPY